jgi:ribosomal protein S25
MIMANQNPILLWIKWRVKNRRGVNILICGEPGSGKSRRGLRIAELTDVNGFNKDKVRYSAEEFIHYLNTKVKAGDVVFWDENIGADASDWYSASNKAVKRSVQVMRKKCFVFINALPSLEDVEPKIRKYFHVYIEPRFFDAKLNGYWCLVMRIQHNPRNKKTYFKYFRFRNRKSGKLYVVKSMFIGNPKTPGLVDDYEADSEVIKDDVHRAGEDIIKYEKVKAGLWGKPKDIEKAVRKIQDNPSEVITCRINAPDYVDVYKVASYCGVGLHTAKRICREVEKLNLIKKKE